jgi:hypothetical protein
LRSTKLTGAQFDIDTGDEVAVITVRKGDAIDRLNQCADFRMPAQGRDDFLGRGGVVAEKIQLQCAVAEFVHQHAPCGIEMFDQGETGPMRRPRPSQGAAV